MSTTINPTTAAVEEKPKRTRKSLADYTVPEGTKFETTPEDWDHTKHKTLPRTAFKDKPAYLEHKADVHERKASALRAEAHEERTAGPALKAKKKFLAAQAMLVKLAAELREQGIDVEALEAEAAS